jgi:hypothetical protein
MTPHLHLEVVRDQPRNSAHRLIVLLLRAMTRFWSTAVGLRALAAPSLIWTVVVVARLRSRPPFLTSATTCKSSASPVAVKRSGRASHEALGYVGGLEASRERGTQEPTVVRHRHQVLCHLSFGLRLFAQQLFTLLTLVIGSLLDLLLLLLWLFFLLLVNCRCR